MRDQPLAVVLGKLASRSRAPGGGAAAAIELAEGAALVAMVGRFTSGEGYADHAALVGEVVQRADEHREAALQLVEDDATAFAAVAAAHALPGDSDDATAARRRAIAVALDRACTPPDGIVTAAAEIVGLAERLLPVANRNVVTDLAAATEAARAAARTAALDIAANLPGVTDGGRRARLLATLEVAADVAARSDRTFDAVHELLTG